MTAKEHNKLVGVFLLAHGALQALIMLFVGIMYGVLGTAMLVNGQRQQEQMVGGVFLGMLVFLLIVTLIFVVPQIIGGFKLLKASPSARIWGIVGSIIAVLSFPIGTAVGVYGLWFLFGDQGKQFYLGGNTAENQNVLNPPAPNTWQ